MLKNTTVTLPLQDFDDLREGEREYRRVARALSACFEYTYITHNNPEPQECKNCAREEDCPDCEINKANPYSTEKLTVDVDQLIRVTKEYALYGKEIETDLDAIPVERKAEGPAE